MRVCSVPHSVLLHRVSDIEDQQPLEGDGDNATSSLSRLDCIGIATGCFVLARCMQLGNGIEKDVDSAMTLFKKVNFNSGSE